MEAEGCLVCRQCCAGRRTPRWPHGMGREKKQQKQQKEQKKKKKEAEEEEERKK